MNRKFCLLVGNGFTVDFIGKSFNTSKPFSNFNNISTSFGNLFYRINPIVDEIKLLASEIGDDFKAIETYLKYHRIGSMEECQLRRFLSIAYSKLQIEIDKQENSNWRWLIWLQNHIQELEFAISFNYDILLEHTLDNCNTEYFRTGTSEIENGIPILKPHGSIDFDLAKVHFESTKTNHNWLNMANEILSRQQVWNMTFSQVETDGIVEIVQKKHWLLPRTQPDIIPPSQANYHKELEWVKKGFLHYNDVAYSITDLLIIGHSYSECDRNEIDYFLERLMPNTIVHIVNPQLVEDLIDKLESLNLEYRIITDFETMPW